jgi:hypothetical protein
VNASPHATSVRFHREGAPRFAIGDVAKLSMSSPSLPETIALSAQVVSRGEAEPHRTYGFELHRRNEGERAMARTYLNVIGRRGAFRVEFSPDESVPVAVLVQALGESHELLGTILDISAGGLRLRLKADAERLLHRVDAFEIRFALPGHDAPLTLSAFIRHRAACPDGVAYGVRFDPERSPDFLEQLEQISEFVMERIG